MSRDPEGRARRQKAIQKIFEQGWEIREQKDLVRHLMTAGFDVTQSSVSRDLRDLGAYRRDGRYELPLESPTSKSLSQIWAYLKGVQPIGNHMILLEVQRGTAGLVANILDETGWADIGGTMASIDDKVLILTADEERQIAVLKNLPAHFLI